MDVATITQVDGAQQSGCWPFVGGCSGGGEPEAGPVAISMWSHSSYIMHENQVIIIIHTKTENLGG